MHFQRFVIAAIVLPLAIAAPIAVSLDQHVHTFQILRIIQEYRGREQELSSCPEG